MKFYNNCYKTDKMSQSVEIMVYYVAKSALCAQELKMYHKIIPALIEVIYHKDSMTVINLQSRQKGGGSALMAHAAKEALKRGIDQIDLDDCSDRYNQKNNLYTKMGMEYVSAGDGPEMEGSAAKISTYPVHGNALIRGVRL